MTPSSRSRMIASRCAAIERHPDRLVVEQLLVRLGRSAVAGLRPDVAGLVRVAGPQLVDELEVVGILLAELLEPLERAASTATWRACASSRSLPASGDQPEPCG